jgi:hypothetical protein
LKSGLDKKKKNDKDEKDICKDGCINSILTMDYVECSCGKGGHSGLEKFCKSCSKKKQKCSVCGKNYKH